MELLAGRNRGMYWLARNQRNSLITIGWSLLHYVADPHERDLRHQDPGTKD